jgi:hypothetical protein
VGKKHQMQKAKGLLGNKVCWTSGRGGRDFEIYLGVCQDQAVGFCWLQRFFRRSTRRYLHVLFSIFFALPDARTPLLLACENFIYTGLRGPASASASASASHKKLARVGFKEDVSGFDGLFID